MNFPRMFRQLLRTLRPKKTRQPWKSYTYRPEPSSIHAKVIGAFVPGYVRVCIGTGMGMMDGGKDIEVPIEQIPVDLRMPNSEFMLLFDAGHQISGVERIPKPRFGAGNV